MGISAKTFLMRRRRKVKHWPDAPVESEPVPPSGAVAFIDLQSPDDDLWYRISVVEISPGVAELNIDPTPVAAGTTPYLVLPFEGDFYKFQVRTDEGDPATEVDDTAPIVESETDALFSTTGFDYEIVLVDDGGLTFDLVPQI